MSQTGNIRRPAPALAGSWAPAYSSAPEFSLSDPVQRNAFLLLAGLTVLLVIAYWNMLALVSVSWRTDDLYSHGYIVPIFALGIMWIRREAIVPASAMERWIGLGILLSALAVRIVGSTFDMNPLDRISFLVALFGAFLMVGGWNLIRWAGPALGFLAFMFPLPSVLEQNLLWNLQKVATIGSTYTLEILGAAPYRLGNTIVLAGEQDIPLRVAEACSGLRMSTIFCALAVAMVFLIERPWWDKFVILLSAIPIALIVNSVRITFTGLMFLWFGEENELVKKIAHDWAGYFMMPMALGLLWLELQILSRLTVPEEAARVQPVGAGRRTSAPVH